MRNKIFNVSLAICIVMLCAIGYECGSNPNPDTDNSVKHNEQALEIKVIEVEGCEYIVAQNGTANGGVSIIHKRNCKYCNMREN